MAIKRGIPLPQAMEQALALADRTSVTELARTLKVSADSASELLEQLQRCGLIRVGALHTGRKGRPLKRALLTRAGVKVLELLRGKGLSVELGGEGLRCLVQRALGQCETCRATEPLDGTCVLVSSYAHLLGLDWKQGVPICSCRRLPKLNKSWRELVKHA